jgi:hypothetical protein
MFLNVQHGQYTNHVMEVLALVFYRFAAVALVADGIADECRQAPD